MEYGNHEGDAKSQNEVVSWAVDSSQAILGGFCKEKKESPETGPAKVKQDAQ
jgi:hypothetical protein